MQSESKVELPELTVSDQDYFLAGVQRKFATLSQHCQSDQKAVSLVARERQFLSALRELAETRSEMDALLETDWPKRCEDLRASLEHAHSELAEARKEIDGRLDQISDLYELLDSSESERDRLRE
jgi:hypothetical protein